MELQVTMDSLVLTVLKVPKVTKEPLVRQVPLELMGQTVLRDLQELLVLQDTTVLKARKVLLELQD